MPVDTGQYLQTWRLGNRHYVNQNGTENTIGGMCISLGNFKDNKSNNDIFTWKQKETSKIPRAWKDELQI